MAEDWNVDDWEVVKIVGMDEDAAVIVGFLQASGIPAEPESLHASEFPADFGRLSEVRIRVPRERAQEALALLNEREDVATGDEGPDAGTPLRGTDRGTDREPGER